LALLEQTRKRVNRIVEEIGRLTEQEIKPGEFYAEFLGRVLAGLNAPAGAVWVTTAQGNLQLQHQINLRQVGLDASEEGRKGHDELLRQTLRAGKPLLIPPHSGAGEPATGGTAASNPTGFLILLAPVMVDQQVTALVEVWQHAHGGPDAANGFLRFLIDMAKLAALYTQNYQRRQMTGQQQLWTQLETYARQIHGSLHPVEVAYQVANEGRRLIDCDRVTVAVRHGKKTVIEAVSGADVVERRSNLVRLMRTLCDAVLDWREKLVYTGTKDDALPPRVLKALDAYLAESNSKLLAVVPLRDEREKAQKRSPRSAILMECFEPAAAPEQLLARLDVVGRHATSALYNAVEHRRIPMRFVWMPIAKVQEGLGGKARVIGLSILVGILVLIAAFYLVPYPLKMEAKGELLPVNRRYVYSPVNARVERFLVLPNQEVDPEQDLAEMYDEKLHKDIIELQGEINKAAEAINSINRRLNETTTSPERAQMLGDLAQHRPTLEARTRQLRELRARVHAAGEDQPGHFYLKAPPMPPGAGGARWTVLTSDFVEKLTHNTVKPSDPVLRLGDTAGPWEVDLKVPQKHIGQVLRGFPYLKSDTLNVDLVVRSDPTSTYKGKLERDKVGGEAQETRDDNNESEPAVHAFVRINGNDIQAKDRISGDLLLTGTEVKAKVRCGDHLLGYSLFYGVWEFLYEKVVFVF
jgi:hypothetical protein